MHTGGFFLSFGVSLREEDFFCSFSIPNIFTSCSQSYPIVLKDFPNVTSIVRKATFHQSTKN